MITEEINFTIIKHPTMRYAVTLQVIHSCGHAGSLMYGDENAAEFDAEHMQNTPCDMCAAGITKKAS